MARGKSRANKQPEPEPPTEREWKEGTIIFDVFHKTTDRTSYLVIEQTAPDHSKNGYTQHGSFRISVGIAGEKNPDGSAKRQMVVLSAFEFAYLMIAGNQALRDESLDYAELRNEQ